MVDAAGGRRRFLRLLLLQEAFQEAPARTRPDHAQIPDYRTDPSEVRDCSLCAYLVYDVRGWRAVGGSDGFSSRSDRQYCLRRSRVSYEGRSSNGPTPAARDG